MNNFNNFLNHLNSFGSKQQPKPGLWVNGNSTQKSSLNEMFNYSYNVEKRDAARAAMNSPDATSQTVSQSIAGHDAAARSEYIKGFHDTNNTDPQVAMAALNSPDATNETTLTYAKHADPQVAMAAVNHSMATSQTVDIASTHPDASVVMAALNHPMATSYTTHNGVGHPNPDVALMALNHPEANGGTIMYGKQHPDSKVVAAAIGRPISDDQIMKNEIEKGNFMYLNHRLRGGKAPDSSTAPDSNPAPQNDLTLRHPIQENTRRSIFLNHLNSFSNKQPIQEQSSNYSYSDSSMKRLGKDLSNPTPIATGALAGGAAGFVLGGPPGALVGSAVGALNGVAYNALPRMINKFSGDDPQYDTNVDRVQKRTEQEEQKRREDVSKANPDLAARMQEDPRNRPGIGKGIARAMNDMSRMQTKVNAASGNLNNLQHPLKENTYRSIFLNHLNSFDKNKKSSNFGPYTGGNNKDKNARAQATKTDNDNSGAGGMVATEDSYDELTKRNPGTDYNTMYGTLTRLAKNNPGRTHGAVLGGVLGGVLGSGIPGAGTAVGAIGGVLGGSAFGGVLDDLHGYIEGPQGFADRERSEEVRKRHEAMAGPEFAERQKQDPRNSPVLKENTRRSIFLNHLNSFSNNIQEASDEGDFAQTRRLKQQGAHPGIPGRLSFRGGPADVATAAADDRPEIGMAALMHPDIDNAGVAMAAHYGAPQVAMAALEHPLTTRATLMFAVQNSNPQVAMAALNHPLMDKHIANTAQTHPDPKVAAAAFAFEGPREQRQEVDRQPSTFAAAEASRQRFPRIDTGARDINGDPIKPAPTPGETAFKQWIKSF
jgi:uncharacterized protein YcfJ